MNTNQTKCVMNILNHLGIKCYLIRAMGTDKRYIGAVYNKSGDTLPFNPYTRLGDSMRIAMLMNMELSFSDKEFFVRPNNNATNETSMVFRLSGDSEVKKVYMVGNAIVNCATAIIKSSNK